MGGDGAIVEWQALRGLSDLVRSMAARIDKHSLKVRLMPEIEKYKGVEIRYGYSISDDQFHAHFNLPAERQGRPQLQRAVLTRFPEAALNPGKNHYQGDTRDEVLEGARAGIDRYLGV